MHFNNPTIEEELSNYANLSFNNNRVNITESMKKMQ